MRNIWHIIRGDARRICRSVVAIVVIMGLCIVPCLYAWFNIFSNWDPYGTDATSRIRVAAVSEDRGADIIGIELNVGDQMIKELEANTQIGWVFVDSREEALELVGPGMEPLAFSVGEMEDLDGLPLPEARVPQMKFRTRLPRQVKPLSILRAQRENS